MHEQRRAVFLSMYVLHFLHLRQPKYFAADDYVSTLSSRKIPASNSTLNMRPQQIPACTNKLCMYKQTLCVLYTVWIFGIIQIFTVQCCNRFPTGSESGGSYIYTKCVTVATLIEVAICRCACMPMIQRCYNPRPWFVCIM